MRDALDLSFSENNLPSSIPSEKLLKHEEKLLEIQDFKEKIQYYNKYIYSLSFPFDSSGLMSRGQHRWDQGDGVLIYKKGQHPDNDPDFETYLEVREEEILRLKKLIDSKKSYADKLRCFIEQKAGQYRFNNKCDDMIVPSNAFIRFSIGANKTVPDHLRGDNNILNLEPDTPDEIKNFNLYVREYVKQLIDDSSKYHWSAKDNYEGFLCKPAIESFTQTLNKAINKDTTIQNKLKEIESYYNIGYIPNYVKELYPSNIENIKYWQSALLNAFINGYDFDLSRKRLTLPEMKCLIHIEEIFDFYKEILKLKEHLQEVISNLKHRKNISKGHNFSFQDSNIDQIKRSPIKSQSWQGTPEQKELLFNELVDQSFIDCSNEIKNKFLNNEVIRWKGSGRDLFYLLEEMKGRKLKLLLQSLNLVPFIQLNFVDKSGNQFKNINQNKSGTYNINTGGKPRQGKIIDTILEKLYTPS